MHIEISTTPSATAKAPRPDIVSLLQREMPEKSLYERVQLRVHIEEAFEDYEKKHTGEADVCIVIRCTDWELQDYLRDYSILSGMSTSSYQSKLTRELTLEALSVIPSSLEEFRRQNTLRSCL